jgi:predicted RNase H-like nuclease (RuvC/YqgF family)
MADMGGQKFLVEPNHDVKILHLQCSIQERKSRLARLKQDIEDLKEMAIKSKEAEIKMLELELAELNQRLDTIAPTNAEVIDVK